ncbi:hypothetical protein EXM65_14635 [Clostridium botulinum]|uniref:Uncharacterized protein n=1 Tax=Clostridium botulinum TaxID=1491 RepID=A0A6M0SVJ0_CLOBO|nr:hypothetical protein [Clostridium botulinum]
MDLEKMQTNITNNLITIEKIYADSENIDNIIGESMKRASIKNELFFQELNDISVTEKQNKNDTIKKKQLKPSTFRLSEDTSKKLKNLNTGKKTIDEELFNLINLKSDFDDMQKLIYGSKIWREEFNRKDIFNKNIEHLYEFLDISYKDYKLILDASLDIIENIAGCSSNNVFTFNSIDETNSLLELLLKVESNAKSCAHLSPKNVHIVCDLVETMINRINVITEELKNKAPLRMRQKKIILRLCLQTLDRLENYKDAEIKELIKKLRTIDYSEISDIEF